MQGEMKPKRSGTRQTLIYIMYRYLYIYHLEGHAEKTKDRSGIYSKKELRSFESHTEKEAHIRTKGGQMGETGVLGWPFNMGGAGQGTGLRAKSLQTPAGSPKPPVPLAGEQGWGRGSSAFGGLGGTYSQRAGLLAQMVAPGGSHIDPCLGSPQITHKDLSTHCQSQRLPYPGCRRSWALLPVGWARDGSRGWVADSGITR